LAEADSCADAHEKCSAHPPCFIAQAFICILIELNEFSFSSHSMAPAEFVVKRDAIQMVSAATDEVAPFEGVHTLLCVCAHSRYCYGRDMMRFTWIAMEASFKPAYMLLLRACVRA
jgi:hypothetical protein